MTAGVVQHYMFASVISELSFCSLSLLTERREETIMVEVGVLVREIMTKVMPWPRQNSDIDRDGQAPQHDLIGENGDTYGGQLRSGMNSCPCPVLCTGNHDMVSATLCCAGVVVLDMAR